MSAARLEGQTALVTGGSRGIGRAIALALARSGADVVITFHTEKGAAEHVASEIARAGRRALVLQADVADRVSVEAAFRELERQWGRLSILVNNAGINKPTDFDKITDADWDRILAVNLRGPFVVTQVFWPLLQAAGAASIVHIGSVSGQYGGPRTAHYAASKAGLISLSQVIARFGAKHGIRSNVVAAGLIESDMAQSGLANPAVQAASQSILLGRLGTQDEVADAVAFLASPEARYITAQTLNVNGGLYF